MSKKKKSQHTISNHNLSCLEEIAYDLDYQRYVLKLCMNDWENEDRFDSNARVEAIFTCMERMVTVRNNLLTLDECIRTGVDFRL